jgi:oxygen-independent coproporphyrinogen-3 oxidase
MLFVVTGNQGGHNTGGHDFSRADSRPLAEGFSPMGADAVRFSTPDSLEQYVAGASPKPNLIDSRAALEETFFLGLRLNRGVDLDQVAREFDTLPLSPVIDELVQDTLLERQGSVIRLTARGRLLSNEVFERFLGVSK